jgi:hypothetical protein
MPSLWDDATAAFIGGPQPQDNSSLWGGLFSLLGQNTQRPQINEPMVQQDPQTGAAIPYKPTPVPSVGDLAYNMSGAKDMQQAYQAAQRGEVLPAIGQGGYGALNAASLAFPALGTAERIGVPMARKFAGSLPTLIDEANVLRLHMANIGIENARARLGGE